MARERRGTGGLLLLALLTAFAFGALVRVAWADHYHSNCVGHGFVHGSSTTDGSFHSRVEDGCGSGTKRCALYNNGSWIGESVTGAGVTCNAWSNNFGSYRECNSTAHVEYGGVFGDHVHKAHNWCG